MAHQRVYTKDDSSTDDEIDDGFVVLDDSPTAPWSNDQASYRPPPPSLAEKAMRYMKDGLKGEALDSLKEALITRVGSSVDRAAFEEALRTLSAKRKRPVPVPYYGTVAVNAAGRHTVQDDVLHADSSSRTGLSNDADEDANPTTTHLSKLTERESSTTAARDFIRSLATLDATKILDGVTNLFGPHPDMIEAERSNPVAENDAGNDPLDVSVGGLQVNDGGDLFDPLGVSTAFKRGPRTAAERNDRQEMLDKWRKMEERNLERDRRRGLRPRPLVSPDTMLKDL
ncbi:MAG: hypothetical protein M1835_007888 [Candelina submexicana]|nr:MAG: hypothetical protein M1835_007888 [Candelina submexicana]